MSGRRIICRTWRMRRMYRCGGTHRSASAARRGAWRSPQREELVLLVSRALELGARPFVLGNGTNVLFPDEGVERLVVNTREMNRVCRGENENEIIAECGASMANMAVFAQKEGLSGLEFAHGIPGSVGGGVTMNAGAYGGELAQVIESVTVLFPDEGVRTLNAGEMAFSYRHSLLTERPEAVVLRAAFRLQPGKPEEIRKKWMNCWQGERLHSHWNIPARAARSSARRGITRRRSSTSAA